MPTYSYHCGVCQNVLDIFHEMTDPAQKICPQCGHESLHCGPGGRVGLSFVESGFYQTDYTARPKEAARCPCCKGSSCAPK